MRIRREPPTSCRVRMTRCRFLSAGAAPHCRAAKLCWRCTGRFWGGRRREGKGGGEAPILKRRVHQGLGQLTAEENNRLRKIKVARRKTDPNAPMIAFSDEKTAKRFGKMFPGFEQVGERRRRRVIGGGATVWRVLDLGMPHQTHFTCMMATYQMYRPAPTPRALCRRASRAPPLLDSRCTE